MLVMLMYWSDSYLAFISAVDHSPTVADITI